MSPPNAIEGLSVIQSGREATKGTAVPATSKMLVESFSFTPEDAVIRPPILNGVLLANTGTEQVITRGSRWSASGPASYEQLMLWFEMVIQGSVTPSATVWTYTRNATAIPVLSSFTLERRLNDGTSQIDNEWAYAMASSLTLSGGPRGLVSYVAEGYARRTQTSTLTAALTLPAAELITHGASRIYIDSTFATLGTSLVSAQLLEWSLTLRPGLMPFFTADGRADLDFPTHVLNSREVALEFTATVLIPGTGSQYAIEKTASEAQTLRAIRLQMVGSGIRDLKIDFLAKHEMGSLLEEGTIDGQVVAKLKFVGGTDAVNFLRVALTNSVATFV